MCVQGRGQRAMRVNVVDACHLYLYSLCAGQAEKHLLLHLLPLHQRRQPAVHSHHPHPERFAEAEHATETLYCSITH